MIEVDRLGSGVGLRVCVDFPKILRLVGRLGSGRRVSAIFQNSPPLRSVRVKGVGYCQFSNSRFNSRANVRGYAREKKCPEGVWYSEDREVIAGLAKHNDSYNGGLWLLSPAGWLIRDQATRFTKNLEICFKIVVCLVIILRVRSHAAIVTIAALRVAVFQIAKTVCCSAAKRIR